MEKRALLAIVLSMVILIASQYLLAPSPKQKPTDETGQAQVANAPTAVANAPSALAPAEQPAARVQAGQQPATAAGPTYPEATVSIDTPLFSAELSSRGGTVSAWTLKTYQDEDGLDVSILKAGGPLRALAIGSGGDFSISNNNFRIEGDDLTLSEMKPTGSVSFIYEGTVYTIKRTYTFHYDSYLFQVQDEVAGLTEYQVTLGSAFGIHDPKGGYSHVGPVVLEGSDRNDLTVKKLKAARLYSEDIKWVAVEDKYFFSAIVPSDSIESAKAWTIADSATVSVIGKPGTHTLQVYAGPKERDRLKEFGLGLEHAVDFGFFSIIALPIFWLLKHLYALVGNYGWAIILLTIIVRVPFLPIVSRGQKAMKRMQEVQPRIQEIREKYKNDPQKMNTEMMNFYRKHKVNPLGGCLPLLLQLPVFLALYKVLLISIELRMAPWAFWITDLSMKDPYYVMPIIMGISMVVQQRMTPTAGDPKQQKIMMFMPVIFTFMFLNFASGLVLYWLVNNLLSIGQQFFVNRAKEPAAAE